VDGDQRQITRKKEYRVGAALDSSRYATRGGDVLPLLAWFEKHFGTPRFRQLGDFIVARDHEDSIPRRCRLHRKLSIALSESSSLLWPERRSEPLFGRVEVLDEHDNPCRHR
jgi:hypothetical protein